MMWYLWIPKYAFPPQGSNSAICPNHSTLSWYEDIKAHKQGTCCTVIKMQFDLSEVMRSSDLVCCTTLVGWPGDWNRPEQVHVM